MKEFDVICIGAAHVDIPLHPVSEQVFKEPSTPLEQIKMTIGGDAANESVILSRLGKKVCLMSRVGNDPAGKFVLDLCRENHVDTGCVCIQEGLDTSLNIGLVTTDGERTFITNRNGSLWKIDRSDINFAVFSIARILSMASIFNSPLLSGNVLTEIFKEAKNHHMIICADIVKSRLGEGLADIAEALSYVDYFFPNYEEACELTGKQEPEEIADVLLELGVKNVIIKTGKKGCYLKNQTENFEVPAIPDICAKDTIGAGDNFAAGFLTGILEGKSLYECARFANATAAISVQSIGSISGVKTRQQVDALLETWNGKKI